MMSKIPCSHCKQEYPQNALEAVKDTQNGGTLYFCCNGCKTVFWLLRDNDLESFYAKLGSNTLQTKNIQDSLHIQPNYDSVHFKQKYLKDKGEIKEVCCIIEGVVCAACVWLNEQILTQLEGVKKVSINYTTHRAKILFDDNVISLSQIIQAIQQIGYHAIIYDPKDTEYTDSKRNMLYYIKLTVAIFCTMNVMWVNVGQYAGFFSGIDSLSSSILNLASFILATPVLFFCASDFYVHAFKGLKNGIIGMEMLVITGTTLVYSYSIYAWLSQSGHTYFESVCMIILFVLSAKFLESLSRKKANDNLDKLHAILPLEARLENGELIAVHDIKPQDKLCVLPGEMVASDGILTSRFATLDYSNISGESRHIHKKEHEEIMAGSMVLEQPIIYEATKTFEDSSMSKLVKLLGESAFTRPKIATFAFKIAGYFSKIVLGIAALGFCYYYFLAHNDFEYSLLIAVSVIVIACPCALALATPIASVVGLNVGFKNHIIFTKASFLESLAKADCVVFDKTGTLTTGNMQVVAIKQYGNLSSYMLDLICQITANNAMTQYHDTRDSALYMPSEICYTDSEIHKNDKRDFNLLPHIANVLDSLIITEIMKRNTHSIAAAIMGYYETNQDSLQTSCLDVMRKIVQSFYDTSDVIWKLIEGRGFYVKIQNLEILGGSKIFMEEMQAITDNNNTQCNDANFSTIQNHTEFYLAVRLMHDNLLESSQHISQDSALQLPYDYQTFLMPQSDNPYKILYILSLQDSLKEDAKPLIQKLKKMQKDVMIMSGDRQEAVDSIAKELGILHYYANYTPLQKAQKIQSLIAQKKNVVMIGDGLNDSLALKYAQVGIAMGSGSEIAIAYSDIIILDDKLQTLSKAFSIANKTFRRIKENLVMSLLYNSFAIPFALCGYVIPLFAAAFMSLSSLSVVLNSLRLYKDKL